MKLLLALLQRRDLWRDSRKGEQQILHKEFTGLPQRRDLRLCLLLATAQGRAQLFALFFQLRSLRNERLRINGRDLLQEFTTAGTIF